MPALWMLAASVLFACMGVCVKLASAQFSAAELVFYRGFISLLLIFAYIRWAKLPLATPHWQAHLTRSLSGFISLVMYFYAISLISLAAAVTLNYTSPLFLAGLLAFWQRERIRPLLYLALLTGFIGIVLVLRPTWHSEQLLGGLFGLGSGVISSIAYLNVRRLGELGEPEWRTVFYFSLVSTLGGLPWLFAATQQVQQTAMTWSGALLLLGVGGFGALAQLCMTRAYKHGKTIAVANLAYSTVIFSTLFAWLLWNEQLPLLALIGVALIIASGVLATTCASAGFSARLRFSFARFRKAGSVHSASPCERD